MKRSKIAGTLGIGEGTVPGIGEHVPHYAPVLLGAWELVTVPKLGDSNREGTICFIF